VRKSTKKENRTIRKDYATHTIYLGIRGGKQFLPTDCPKVKDIVLMEFHHFTMFEADGVLPKRTSKQWWSRLLVMTSTMSGGST
jgi:hypothetical protein